MTQDTTPSQGLDAATVERCAQVVDAADDFKHPYARVALERVAATLRALATDPHQHGGKGA